MDGTRDDTIVVFEGTSVIGRNGGNLITPAVLTDMVLGSAYNDCSVRMVKEQVPTRS